MTQMNGLPIANIVMAEVIDEITNKKYIFDTASKAQIKPDLSKGKEDILRVKNRIIAINRTEDICIGYNIKLTNNTFPAKVMAIIDGGIITNNGYEGPDLGEVAERHPYTLNIYSEEKDYGGETLQYVKFSFKHNKGKPVEFKFEDGKFYIPEFESQSRPRKKEKPVYIEYMNKLPDYDDGNDNNNGNEEELEVVGGKVEDSNSDVSVEITSNIKWTFSKAINQDEVTSSNFIVKKKSTNGIVQGNVTIDETKKIVTFVPASIEKSTIYVAEVKGIRLLTGNEITTPISVEFTTI